MATAKAIPEEPRSEKEPSSHRRLIVLAVVFGLLTAFWIYQTRFRTPGALPQIPAPDLNGADPEVAAAVAKARDAVIEAPTSSESWGIFGMVLHAHVFREEACVAYEAAEILDPHSPLWPYLRGIVLQDSSRPVAAIPCFERACQLAPPNSLARLRLADMRADKGQFDAAESEYRTVLAADPDDVHAMFGLGQIAANRSDEKGALHWLPRAAACPHSRKRAAATLSAVYEKQGDTAAAASERKRVLALPEDAPWPDEALDQVAARRVGLDGALRRAMALESAGRITALVEVLRETTRAYPKADKAWASLGQALGFTKDYKGAEQAMLRCLELSPQRGDYWFSLGAARSMQQRFDAAAEAFAKTVELNPTDGNAWFQLADCREKTGDYAGAANAYRTALRYHPELEEARSRLQRMTKKS